ncbi:MAG: hypothetical protein AB1405_18645, partial [Bdellovibrionota bacterium]
MSTPALKDPDAIFEANGQQPLSFEDLTERAAVKLTSLLRLVARTNWPLFQENIIPNEQRTKTGLTAIIYRMELESTGNSVDLTKPAKVDVKISLAHAGEGKDRRIISVSDIGLWGNAIRENNYVLAARVYIHHVFTRPFGPPENRRVTELEAPLGFSKPFPDRKIDFLRPEDLLSPPEGLKPLHSDLSDGEPHVWAYELTDLNQHVHAMDYVGTGITFAADQMARVGHPPGDYYFS